MSVRCQFDIYVSFSCSVAEWGFFPSWSNSSFNCCPLAIKVRGHKVLDHMTGKSGTLLNLTPSSNFTFWNTYSHFCPSLHSLKQVFLVSQSMSVSKWGLDLNSSTWKKSPDLCGALGHFIHGMIWDHKRLCVLIWCCPFQNRMTRNECFGKISWQCTVWCCCAVGRGWPAEAVQAVGLCPANGADLPSRLLIY